MKLKYIAAVYTVLILLGAVFWGRNADRQDFSRDMVYYNGQLKQIEEGLEKGESRAQLESAYQCTLIFLSDEACKSRINEQIKKGGIIMDIYQSGVLTAKAVWNTEENQYEELRRRTYLSMAFLCLSVLFIGYILLVCVYFLFIRPFKRLQEFSAQIAKGNLDFPLPMKKQNYFGAFTESFDILREELKAARESEYRANKSKKELVVELSHDIKTPVATIKAACEVLQAKEQNEDTLKKVEVIAGKAEMIDSLISNLFHATLEELEVLKVEPAEAESGCIMQMLEERKYYGEIILENRIPECLVYIDKLRLQQVIDNIINNACKYAGTAVFVSFYETGEGIRIRIRDEGEGVPEEELPLVVEKFYRGSNAKEKAGSGLGLYLCGMFMEQMKGGMEYYNENGFVVVLFVRKV